MTEIDKTDEDIKKQVDEILGLHHHGLFDALPDEVVSVERISSEIAAVLETTRTYQGFTIDKIVYDYPKIHVHYKRPVQANDAAIVDDYLFIHNGLTWEKAKL